MIRSILGFSTLLLLVACNTPRVASIEETVVIEERVLDTLFVTAPPITETMEEEIYFLPTYNASATQKNDLLHTRLDLSFDWEKEQVIGQARLRLKPYFYATSSLVLDAKNFDIKSITNGEIPLTYKYDDDNQIYIELDKKYTREEEYEILIDYIATPRADGGSDAITSDKGLFFINPRGEEVGKPQQIWTQGETENNSRWFPTIDKPNERCTQEMYITVQDKYVTLSNGALVSSTKNDDGTRTDYWNMTQPHAPYLFMLTVGDFAVVEDAPWNGTVPVNYYVEQEYEADAKKIFPHTPEMLTFFSDITGVSYPWQKYSQIVVRDYVSGAMENTTGVIFGEFVQLHERELIDVLTNDKIVAHEMMHHWFGDYVTCENWANLTLNEGFANYSEYLWLEHKFGKDEADFHLLAEWDGYLSSAIEEIHPLIHYGYDDKEDMFDTHSYNKGGSILHMLRNIVGDDAFFAAYQKYLEDNAYTAVEVDELRMAFEDVTGKDLNWFFDQWFHGQGHPVLSIEYAYDDGEAIIDVKQTQSREGVPLIFQLPVAIDIYLPSKKEAIRRMVMMDEREQTFRFRVSEKPALIIFDADRNLLAERDDVKSNEQLVYQFKHAPHFLDRYEAITQISDPIAFDQILSSALQDDFYGIRQIALESIDPTEEMSEGVTDHLYLMAEKEPHSDVRALALLLIAELGDARALTLAKKAIEAKAYNVVSAGLETVYQISPKEGLEGAEKLKNEKSADIIATIGGIYAIEGKEEYLPYFNDHLTDVDGFGALDFYESYADILIGNHSSTFEESIDALRNIGVDQGQSPWRRFAAIKSLSQLNTFLVVETEGDSDLDPAFVAKTRVAIDEIKEKETIAELKRIYQQY